MEQINNIDKYYNISNIISGITDIFKSSSIDFITFEIVYSTIINWNYGWNVDIGDLSKAMLDAKVICTTTEQEEKLGQYMSVLEQRVADLTADERK